MGWSGFAKSSWGFLDELASGVPLGVGVEVPRTPAVYDPKVKWALDDLGGELDREVENYSGDHKFTDKNGISHSFAVGPISTDGNGEKRAYGHIITGEL